MTVSYLCFFYCTYVLFRLLIFDSKALIPHSKKALGSDPGSFYVEFTCSHCACVGFPQVFQFPPTVNQLKYKNAG